MSHLRRVHRLSLAVLLAMTAAALGYADMAPVALVNPDFAAGADAAGLPRGWGRYAGSQDATAKVVEAAPGTHAVLLQDNDANAEIGVTQAFPAKPNLLYRVTVKVRAVAGATPAGSHCQLRFLPANTLAQVELATEVSQGWDEIVVEGVAPPDTTQAMIYLYSHKEPTPVVLIGGVSVAAGPAPPPPPKPEVKQYDRLKDLHLSIPLVEGGKSTVSIVAPASGIYSAAATSLQAAVQTHTGARVPIVSDSDLAAAVPLRGNLIVLGNRSTNLTSNALYDLYYSLMDLKYPGVGGYAVRTLHDPFANGYSAILVGGSDAAGVTEAAAVLARKLTATAPVDGKLAVGWLMETRLGKGLTPPADARQAEIWEASKMYGSTGYFGWNSISKCMAQFYMAGDQHAAREVVRLAFPDAQALKEIDQIDGERIENKHDPLAGTYHYNSHMMMLFWDLIEESPVFTDAERLKITNALARQIHHRLIVQREGTYFVTTAPGAVSSRHGQWAAISLYVLGRYFNKYYPDPMWAQCQRGGELCFHSLHKHAWVHGESDNLYWFNTGTAPILTYMVLTGDRIPLQNGVLPELLRGQEILANGRTPDGNLTGAAMDFLNKAAYLTGDGRWITYRGRTQVDTDVFRLGQSYWPDEQVIKPALPTDLVGRWTIMPMPRPMRDSRASGIPYANCFRFGSYRSAPDARGDYVLLDGYDENSRNPCHTFDVLELRLNGRTCLAGYHNQVVTSADGMVEPVVARDGALLHRNVLGPMATAVGEVPKAAFCNWRRTLAQRTGKYAVVVDDLTFRADSQNMKVTTTWQPSSGVWNPSEQAIRLVAGGAAVVLPGWVQFRALDAKWTSDPPGPEHVVALDSLGAMLLRATEVGPWMEMTFHLDRPASGEFYADFLNYVDRGRVRISIDGKPIGEDFDNYADDVKETRISLGRLTLPAGEHRLRLTVVGVRAGNAKANIGFGGLAIRPDGAVPVNTPSYYDLRSCDVQPATSAGGICSFEWQGPVKQGEHRRTFTLLAQGTETTPPACLRVADNAAAMCLPTPALAVTGDYRACAGELVIVAGDHLSGHALTSAGLDQALVSADVPVDLDWDFTAGVIEVESTREATLTLRLADGGKLLLDAAAVATVAGTAPGTTAVKLGAGRHKLAGAVPAGEAETQLGEGLTTLVAAGRKQRVDQLAAAAGTPRLALPPLAATATAQVGGKVVAMIAMPSPQGTLLAIAEEKTVHLLALDGKPVRTLQADGKIRAINWWADHRLLLVGCQDEKVIAFDESGARKWTFTSVMDPAVYEAAKPYWFKTAPGHEGVHSLHTGVFYGGKSQCVVGSACTLEVIDEAGQLVKRMPVFWGPVWKFLPVNGPDKSLNLLMAQWPNGSDNVRILNNGKDAVGAGYNGVPAGHTYVGGWTAQNRTALVRADLEGDGTAEVVTLINGIWNRLTVFAEDGTPRYNAQFGPGAQAAPRSRMRDLAVADLNGDGKQELVVATAEGLVVALTGRCEKLWSVNLPAAPMSLQAMTPAGARSALLVAGCVDGSLYVIDGEGALRRSGRVTGSPGAMMAVVTPTGPQVVAATDKGEVACLAPTL